jgi:hypothetical protein
MIASDVISAAPGPKMEIPAPRGTFSTLKPLMLKWRFPRMTTLPPSSTTPFAASNVIGLPGKPECAGSTVSLYVAARIATLSPARAIRAAWEIVRSGSSGVPGLVSAAMRLDPSTT